MMVFAPRNDGFEMHFGTINPDTKLHVEGQIKITGGNPGSNKVLINSGSSASGVVLGGNLTIDVVESSIDLSKTTGRVSLSRVLQQEPGTVDAEYYFGNLATTDVPDENGDITYDGEEF